MSGTQIPTIKLTTGDVVSLKECDRVFAEVKTRCSTPSEASSDLLAFSGICSQWGLAGPAIFYVSKALDYADDAGTKAKCYLRLGGLKEKERDYTGAAMFYAEAFALEPGKDDVWYFLNNNLGYCLNRLGKQEKAEFYCRAAIEISPNRHNAYKNLGIAFDGQGKYVEAARMFSRAAELCPQDPRALYHLRDLVKAHKEVIKEEPSILARLEALERFACAGRPGIIN